MPKIQESIGNLQTTKADKSELSNYATKTDLNNKTERPLFEAMLQNYATKSELNNHQVDFSKLIIHYGKLNKNNNYIRSDEYKATKDEKGNFVFQLDDDFAPFKVKQILTKDLPELTQMIMQLRLDLNNAIEKIKELQKNNTDFSKLEFVKDINTSNGYEYRHVFYPTYDAQQGKWVIDLSRDFTAYKVRKYLEGGGSR